MQVDLKTRGHALAAPRSTAHSRDFSTPLQVQETEAVWADIESRAAIALTALNQGQNFSASAIKDLVALHLIRSYEMLEECHSLFNDYEPLTRLTRLSVGELQLHALERSGLHIVGPEAARSEQQEINELIYQHFREELCANLPPLLAQARGLFAAAGLQVWTCEDGAELLIGDTPAATIDHTGTRVGFGAGVWPGSAGTAIMPLSPTKLAAIGPRDLVRSLPTSQVAKLNLIQARRAQRFIYCHPRSDLHEWVLAEHKKFLDSVANPDRQN